MPYHLKAALAFAAIVTGTGPANAQHRSAPAAHPAGTPRAEIVRPETNENLEWAASVVVVNDLRRQGNLTAKLFGNAGGDPAMNGLNAYIAFYGSPDEDWKIFSLGDFLSYRIVSETPGRVTLEVQESIMNQRTGDIGSRLRRFTISWAAVPDGETPASISIAAAR